MASSKLKRILCGMLVMAMMFSQLSIGGLDVRAEDNGQAVMSEQGKEKIETEDVVGESLEKAEAAEILYSGTSGDLDWSIDACLKRCACKV